jgi:hypothetical protein
MLRKCSICEREFAASHELNRHYTDEIVPVGNRYYTKATATLHGTDYELNRHYTTVCPECQAIDPRTRSEEDRLGELRVLIEKVWREYQNLQDQYRKLTGKEHGWLR